ncbi:hypothetical protein Tco_0930639, partial [Tanacetum coccineum]
YVSTMPGIKETAASNWFVCLNSEKSSSKAFTLSSNLNTELKVGRFYGEVLGIIVVWELVFVAEVEKEEWVVEEIDPVFRLRMESIPVSGLGLSMFEMKPDEIEELCF